MGQKCSEIEHALRIPVVFWSAGSFNLVNFGIFASVGSATGYSLCFFYLQTRGIPVGRFCWDMVLVLTLFTILFAKLFAAFSVGLSGYCRNFRHYFNETTFYQQGGMIGTIAGSVVLCLLLEIPLTTLGDAVSLGGIAMMAVGRIGCHQYGCCVGRPATGRFAIIYQDPLAKICRENPGLRNTPLIPVQLMASAFDFMIFVLCCLVSANLPVSGLIILIFITGVNLKRIAIQNFRLKPTGNKIPYRLTAFSIIILTVLILWLFQYRGTSFFEKEYPVVPFTISGYFRFLVSDFRIITSLVFVAVINFATYGIHGRRIGTHTNLAV